MKLLTNFGTSLTGLFIFKINSVWFSYSKSWTNEIKSFRKKIKKTWLEFHTHARTTFKVTILNSNFPRITTTLFTAKTHKKIFTHPKLSFRKSKKYTMPITLNQISNRFSQSPQKPLDKKKKKEENPQKKNQWVFAFFNSLWKGSVELDIGVSCPSGIVLFPLSFSRGKTWPSRRGAAAESSLRVWFPGFDSAAGRSIAERGVRAFHREKKKRRRERDAVEEETELPNALLRRATRRGKTAEGGKRRKSTSKASAASFTADYMTGCVCVCVYTLRLCAFPCKSARVSGYTNPSVDAKLKSIFR